ncbi:toxin-antitoxin system TumE family protein [Lichenicoccus sp.]|uniref:toxin-antitoxin system TumE family protein n=1 Tax=Lichenicoccus sp. TaxID=2781899 RepID=UPI003D136D98
MRARLIQSDKTRFENGAIREVRIWLVPEPVPPATHHFKYSLVYVVEGVRVIGFDNERGKGDHCHLHGLQSPYDFQGIARLLADFRKLVEQERGD